MRQQMINSQILRHILGGMIGRHTFSDRRSGMEVTGKYSKSCWHTGSFGISDKTTDYLRLTFHCDKIQIKKSKYILSLNVCMLQDAM